MTTVKSRAFTVVRTLFKLGLLACFTLGSLLVLGQLAGVVAQRPDWITASSSWLFVPTVTAAAVFGVLGYVGNYLAPDTTDGEE
ncbi:hypothetical protein Q8791_28080 [Nocardiopsis sp. CT-R113]|uniref:Uncharacterized protein n=1 Tax=Nocardiopsis codii TaxID=3065942 RepID=A0ABU7KFU8_9ACTN|nr:hypothetical protein [Nocardiopsis sp. CT-R113]MEE2041088.1 hypothetical protein [Nocardiopsis sp. CT-R113]